MRSSWEPSSCPARREPEDARLVPAAPSVHGAHDSTKGPSPGVGVRLGQLPAWSALRTDSRCGATHR